jgi:hypothetical protein
MSKPKRTKLSVSFVPHDARHTPSRTTAPATASRRSVRIGFVAASSSGEDEGEEEEDRGYEDDVGAPSRVSAFRADAGVARRERLPDRLMRRAIIEMRADRARARPRHLACRCGSQRGSCGAGTGLDVGRRRHGLETRCHGRRTM